MINSSERAFKNETLNKNFPGLDLEVDDNGKISDVEFPDGWTPADTEKILCKLITTFASEKWHAYINAR